MMFWKSDRDIKELKNSFDKFLKEFGLLLISEWGIADLEGGLLKSLKIREGVMWKTEQVNSVLLQDLQLKPVR